VADVTTLLERDPQTAAGFPRSEGSSLCSTEIKKASISMCRMIRSIIRITGFEGSRGQGFEGHDESHGLTGAPNPNSYL
jgi:hypothetical protein